MKNIHWKVLLLTCLVFATSAILSRFNWTKIAEAQSDGPTMLAPNLAFVSLFWTCQAPAPPASNPFVPTLERCSDPPQTGSGHEQHSGCSAAGQSRKSFCMEAAPTWRSIGGPAPDNFHLTGVILCLNDDGSTPSDKLTVAEWRVHGE